MELEINRTESLDYSDKNISECFDEALKSFEEICESTLATNSSEVQYKVKKCMNMLEDLTRMVSSAGMFSSNESADEIPTNNVKFLLLPVMLGTLALKLTNGDRLEIVRTAEIYFRDFLQRCKDYGIKDVDIPAVSETNEDGEVCPRNVDLMAMARRRATKIQQYKEQKEMEGQMSLLRKEFESDRVDEEIRRKYYLSFITCYANKALDDLDCLMSEKELLTRVNQERPFGAPVWPEDEKTKKPNRSRPLQAVILTKDEMQKKVFGYGYPSLPTMTVAELYEQRMRDGTWAPPSTKNPSSVQEFSGAERSLLEQSEKEHELKTEEAVEKDDSDYLDSVRSMDEYKDDHPRGWGNRYNRS